MMQQHFAVNFQRCNIAVKDCCNVYAIFVCYMGCLMYAVMGSRPDICATITMLSRFQDCASAMLYKLLKNVLRYIKGTIHLNLVYKRDDSNDIEGFADSDWRGNPQDRRSTTGYCFKVFNCTVIWSSKKQQSVALSTTKSEYTALSTATSEACWLKELLLEFGISVNCITLYEDNQSAIKIAHNPANRKIKHLGPVPQLTLTEV